MKKSKLLIELKKPVIKLIKFKTPTTVKGDKEIFSIVNYLEKNKFKNILLVIDVNLKQYDLYNEFISTLTNYNLFFLETITHEPDLNSIKDVETKYLENNCDCIVAIGGGSILDASKIASLTINNGCNALKLVGMFKAIRSSVPLIAVPTTAGTGSEVSIGAVVIDKNSKKKHIIIDNKCLPDFVILEPGFFVKLPSVITIYTAIDALTHAIESYVSDFSTTKSKQDALIGIKLIYDNIERSLKDPTNIDVRLALLEGSYYAGKAFTKTYVGYVHAFAHQLGALYNIPHGLANGVFLLDVLKFYEFKCLTDFATIAEHIGLIEGSSQSEMSKNLLNWIEHIINMLLSESKKLDIDIDIEEITRRGLIECHGTYAVPKYLSYEDAILLVKNSISKFQV